MNNDEVLRVQAYLRLKFSNDMLTLKRGAKDDMVEVFMEDEFIGTLFRALPVGPRTKRLAPPLFICDSVDTPKPTCESSYDLGRTAQASYSFKRAYLSDWETIDSRIRDMIRSFRAAARAR